MSETKPGTPDTSPGRLKHLLEIANIFMTRTGEVFGGANLEATYGKQVIVAVDHTSDLSIPASMAYLAPRRNLGIAHISAQTFRNDPLTSIWIRLLGKKSFFDINFDRSNGKWISGRIKQDNYVQMRSAMERGKTMLIAAHDPVDDFQLRSRGGIAAVLLGSITPGSLVLPMAVDAHIKPRDIGREGSGNTFGLLNNFRPKVDIHFGEPLMFSLLPESDFFPMTRNGSQILRTRSNLLMHAIANLMPPEKRGNWIDPQYNPKQTILS